MNNNDGRFHDRYIQYLTHLMEPCRSVNTLKLQIDEKIQELQDRFYYSQFRLLSVSIEHYACQDPTSQVRSYINQWTALITYSVIDKTREE